VKRRQGEATRTSVCVGKQKVMQASVSALVGSATIPGDQLKVPFSKGMSTKLSYEIAPNEPCLELGENILFKAVFHEICRIFYDTQSSQKNSTNLVDL